MYSEVTRFESRPQNWVPYFLLFIMETSCGRLKLNKQKKVPDDVALGFPSGKWWSLIHTPIIYYVLKITVTVRT